MNAQHTPGRLTIDDAYTRIAKAADGRDIFLTHEYGNAEANANRLAACWNACDGIDTEALEQMEGSDSQLATAARILNVQLLRQRDELLEALRIAEAALSDIGDADREPGDDVAWCEARAAEAIPQVRAAIAKVKGGAV